jgi:hypothetical protein
MSAMLVDVHQQVINGNWSAQFLTGVFSVNLVWIARFRRGEKNEGGGLIVFLYNPCIIIKLYKD